MKSELITMLSHELRTPLTSLGLAAGLIRFETPAHSTGAHRRSAEIIGRNVRRLSRLADDVFLLSQADQGGYPLRAERLRLLPAVEAALDAVKEETAGASGKTFSIAVPQEAYALVDANAFSQIVRHLLNNAVMHTPEGTAVSVSCENATPGFVDLLVRDDGSGLPEESLRDIFERFYQARKSVGSGYRGIGLGLAICRILAEKMGGGISVESRLGKGTVFRVSFPVGPTGNPHPDDDTVASPRKDEEGAPPVVKEVQ
jgi:signal transduction histidine kinase